MKMVRATMLTSCTSCMLLLFLMLHSTTTDAAVSPENSIDDLMDGDVGEKGDFLTPLKASASAASASSRRVAPTDVPLADPLDIEVTKDWEQIVAEVWAAVSTGRMPKLPQPIILGENNNDDGETNALEQEVYADEENTRRAKAFVATANKRDNDLEKDGEALLAKDKRCEDLWKILEKHIDDKRNATVLELGAGSPLYVPARQEHTSSSSS